ncbi:MAG: dihydrolipoyl dehydrogenase [SAR324 cluster bacterium]|nr:dihydrolipoyl dehydrogenase [SAR324 cluster bacterium]
MEQIQTNTVVIGGGPGGYAAAIRLGQLGIETVLIEKEHVGGTCLNVGCIPSKALLHASASFTHMKKEAPVLGIHVAEPTINWAETIGWKDGIVKQLVQGIQGLLKNNKVQLIKGSGKLLGPNQVEVDSLSPVRIDCQNIILATGSKVLNLPPFPVDQQKILDSTGLLSLKTIPQSMVMLGGGIIGMEMGTVYAALGTKVTIVEMLDRILPTCESESAGLVAREFKKMGGDVFTSTKAVSCDTSGKGIRLTCEKEGKSLILEADLLAVTVGRRPNFDNLNLEVLGLQLDKGRIPVNDQLQTIFPNVYAIGDVINGPMLAHKATAEGVLAAEIISGEKASREDLRIIPDVVYTKPEVANAGLLEEQALARDIPIKVGKFPIAALGRSLTTNEALGYVKYVADAADDRIIGATIVSYKASEMIAEATLAIEMGATLEDVALTIHPHPSFSEGHMEAAAAALKKAIHIFNK